MLVVTDNTSSGTTTPRNAEACHSRPGGYAQIYRAILDDATFTDAECKLATFLAARPPGWVIIPSVIARDLKRSLRHWVIPTLRLLEARGLVEHHGGRARGAMSTRLTYTINRELLVASSQVGPDMSDSAERLPDPDITCELDVSASSQVGPDMSDSARRLPDSDTTRVSNDLSKKDLKNPCSSQLPGMSAPEAAEPVSSSPKRPNLTVQQRAAFDTWWKVYPRKDSKLAAERAFPKALGHADANMLIAAARRYRDDPNRVARFTKMPATWLNQGCWEDGPLPPREYDGDCEEPVARGRIRAGSKCRPAEDEGDAGELFAF